MEALDMNKLRGASKSIAKKAGQGDGNMVYSGKLPEEMDIKLAPPVSAEAAGLYYVEQEGWWIDGKFYLSNSTPCLGGDDVIQEEIDDAEAQNDASLDALINKSDKGMKKLKKETRYLVPFFQLDIATGNDGEITSVKVVDDECKVLVAKPTLLLAINKVVTSRPFQNGTPSGAADREKGNPIVIGKEGTGKNTNYTAVGWNAPVVLDEKYYDDKKIEDCFAITRKMQKSDTHLRSAIRNYLYGEDIIEDEKEKESEAGTSARTATKPATAAARPSKTPPAAEAKKEPASTARPTKAKTEAEPSKSTRSLLGDVAGMIDELD